MESLFDWFSGNPVATVAGVLIVGIIMISLVKKALKLALLMLVVFACYLAYLNYSGQEISGDVAEVRNKIDWAADKVTTGVGKVRRKIEDEMKK